MVLLIWPKQKAEPESFGHLGWSLIVPHCSLPAYTGQTLEGS